MAYPAYLSPNGRTDFFSQSVGALLFSFFAERILVLTDLLRAFAFRAPVPDTPHPWGMSEPMVFEQIDRLRSEYTDRYVVVDDTRPELRRFKGFTGTVRTVNMSGRALVEFDGRDNDIGWYDIDIDFLKVIDEPLPKAKPVKKAAAKPAAKKAPAKAAKKPAMSVEEMLAAARGNKPAEASAKAETKPAPAKLDPSKMSVEDMLAAARGNKPAEASPKAEAKPAPAKLDPSKMSVEDMLAAARGNKPAAGEQATEPEEEDEYRLRPLQDDDSN
jgi:hypothetical protein